MPEDTAERINNIARIKISRCNLVQHRREKNEILTTNQHHFRIGPASESFV
jgi:hypothetical protein